MVERLVWDEKVAGSNPVCPTKFMFDFVFIEPNLADLISKEFDEKYSPPWDVVGDPGFISYNKGIVGAIHVDDVWIDGETIQAADPEFFHKLHQAMNRVVNQSVNLGNPKNAQGFQG